MGLERKAVSETVVAGLVRMFKRLCLRNRGFGHMGWPRPERQWLFRESEGKRKYKKLVGSDPNRHKYKDVFSEPSHGLFA